MGKNKILNIDAMNIGDESEINELKQRLARYYFASKIVRDEANILDCACGNGYGSFLLSNIFKNSNFVSIDSEYASIKKAQNDFSKENIKFINDDLFNVELERESYDFVVSFETIEHVSDYEKFILLYKNILKKDGVLIISTPNKFLVSPNLKKPLNIFHIKEFEQEELQSLLEKHFSEVSPYVQRHNANKNILKFRQIVSRILSFSSHLNVVFLNVLRVINSLLNKKVYVPVDNLNLNRLFNEDLSEDVFYPTKFIGQSKYEYLFEIFVCKK